MRDLNQCWLQTPEILEEEIQTRKDLLKDMVGTLYPSILIDEIVKLREIMVRRKDELTSEDQAQ